MARKFGKKNVIKIDPLAYNIGVIGESGIGKTTLAKEVCEKLVGEDGYIIANIGREDGIDAISGAMYEDIPDFDTFDEFCDDIIENKLTDYADLKVVVWDTIDELLRIAEPETIRLYNKQSDKTAKTIKQAWGGFGAGEKYTVDLIMDRLWELKKVGVKMFLVGHTKKRTMTDPASNQEYDMLTTNMTHSYFNALKTKLHFLGVASIDRVIVREKTGKKDIVTKKEIEVGAVKGMERKVTFRDDNFSIDSKSRFADIVEEIPLDSDEFIKAITDAITAEATKDGSDKPVEDRAKEQEKQARKKEEAEFKKIEAKRLEEEMDMIKIKISSFIKKNKTSDPAKLKELLLKMKEFGYSSPTKIESIEEARELSKLAE